MNTIKIKILQYRPRLKFLICALLMMGLIGFLLRSFGWFKPRRRPNPIFGANPLFNATMTKALEYCNPPHTIKLGDEGKPAVAGGILEFAALVIRHGDKAPTFYVRNQHELKCNPESNNLQTNYIQTMKLISSQIGFSAYPIHEDCRKAGKLTRIGAQQLLNLGQLLRQVYVEKLGLVEEKQLVDNVDVIATSMPRTFQSAMAFLYGFLMTPNISQIRINRTEDYRFCFDNSTRYCECPAQVFNVEEKRNLMNLTLTQPKIFTLLQRLSPIIKYQPNQLDITDSSDLFDALAAYFCHYHELPCHPNTKDCVTYEHLHLIINHLKWQKTQMYFNRNYGQDVGLHSMKNFLVDLNNKVQDFLKLKKTAKFTVYSGHSLSIDLILQALGVEDTNVTPYASRLIFEVYSYILENSRQYALKVLFNGMDITMNTSFCSMFEKNSIPKRNICPLEMFQKFVEFSVSSKIYLPWLETCY